MLDSALFFMWPEIFGNYTFMGDDAPEPVTEGECCTWLLAPDQGFCSLLSSWQPNVRTLAAQCSSAWSWLLYT